ncbi:MAG: hypothetical protein ACLSWS_18910 [Faecalispora jeddahensis]
MRLIDKDTLGVSRCNPDVFKVPGRAEGWNSLLDIVNSAPTIDAVPVVRCRECSKKDKNICPLVLVQFDRNMKQVLVQKPVPDDFFCSYGQRKEADHEVPEP